MGELNFSTGVKEFTINGKVKVYFNPTDIAFIERVFSLFDKMDEAQEEYNAATKNASGMTDILERYRNHESTVRGLINDVFGADVCDAIFYDEACGSLSVFSLSEGLPLWVNLMLAIIDKTDEAFSAEKKATNPRIKKYTAKYNKGK